MSRFPQGLERLRQAAFPGVKIGDTENEAGCRSRLAASDEGLRRQPLCLDVGVRELPKPNHAIDGALFVASRATILNQPVVVRPCIEQQTIPAGNVCQLPERVIVVTPDLEHFLVDGRRAREEPLAVKMVSGPVELLRRAISLTGFDVKIAKSVGGVPVVRVVLEQTDVLLDGCGDLALLAKFFRLLECFVSVDCHSIDRIKQASLRLERAAMQWRIAVPRDGGQVFGGGVALVTVVAVARIASVQREHLAIARHLGDDRCGGDRRAPAVAVQHATLRDHQSPGMRKASTSTMSGSGAMAITARRIASSEARWMLIVSISAGSAQATDQASALRVITS